MPNRLASEKSLYLRQHQDNPIDWWPWGDEAWDTAKRLGRPVFLSVGYSSCHWCHVMAHESFEDPETAAALNESFISIKLDREERPDIDEIYMTAVQLANGHGGWPMTLFLTPNKKPFFAGTYFPKDARAGHPGFLTVINSLASAWENEKDSVLKAADDFAVALAAALERSMPGSNDLSLELILAAIAEFHTSFDHENGGFGDQPKFPPFSALEFLDKCSHSPLLEQELDLRLDCAAMVSRTVKALSQGGITDHVGGGIHRYSTDSHWHLPHFEKMLTDNAQWVSVLCNTDPDSFALRRAIDWIESKMTGSDGTFFSAMDADSEGQEGAYYLWREQEVLDLTSPAFAFAFGVKSEGNFHDEATGQLSGLNVLNFQGPSIEQYSSELDALSGWRQKRTSPLTDKKAVAAGNGLMISALSRVRPALALRAAETWLHHLRLPRFLYEGQPYGEAFLEDLAYMARGYLDLYDKTKDTKWLSAAESLCAQIIDEHADGPHGLYFVSSRSEFVIGRTMPFLDSATPSPIAIAISALRRLGQLERAQSLLLSGSGWMMRAPQGTASLLNEALFALTSPSRKAHQHTPAKRRVKVRAEPNFIPVEDDGFGYVEVVIDVPEGSHINSNDPIADWLVPTEVTVLGAHAEASFPEPLDGTYRGETRIPVRIRPIGSLPSLVRVGVRLQECTESECRLPETFELTVQLVEN